MNRLGILIDLSHCGERTTMEAIELSACPVSITHSNPREYVGTPGFGPGRLKATEAIKLLAKRGGVLGLSPNPHLTREAAAGTRDQFCDMVAWTVDRVGIDHVGIGSDYCPGHPPLTRDRWRYGKWSREKIEKPIAPPGEGWADWFKTSADFQEIRKGLHCPRFHQHRRRQSNGPQLPQAVHGSVRAENLIRRGTAMPTLRPASHVMSPERAGATFPTALELYSIILPTHDA